MKKILLGNEAIIQGALEAGVDFVSGYPGCPSAEIGDGFGKIAKNMGFMLNGQQMKKRAWKLQLAPVFQD